LGKNKDLEQPNQALASALKDLLQSIRVSLVITNSYYLLSI